LAIRILSKKQKKELFYERLLFYKEYTFKKLKELL